MVVFRSGCRFCSESVPFYRRIVASAATHKGRTRIVGVTSDAPKLAEEYLGTSGVSLDAIVASVREPVSAMGTPTLLLTDRTGRIRHIWSGRLSPQAEEEVIAAVVAPPL